MSVLNPRSKVLLPQWLLRKEKELPGHVFLAEVRSYLLRYPDYQQIRVESGIAVCDRPKGGQDG